MIKENKIKSRRKVLQLSAAFFMAVLFLVSCRKEYTNIGEGLEEGSLNGAFIDTFSLVTYSELADSVETDETAVNLLGSYVDPVFGKVDCGIATQIRLSSSNPVFGPSATLTMDSVILSLTFTSIKFYANHAPVTVEVYEITDDLNRDDETYYAFDSPNTTGPDLVKVGSGTFLPNVVDDASDVDEVADIDLHLDPTAFGMKMVSANEAGHLASDEAFLDYFKGLYIKVNGTGLSAGEGSVLYFVLENSNSNVTMYFHDDLVAKSYTFSINSSCARYNDIKFDRTGTVVDATLLDASLGAEAFYMQGTAIRAVVEVPNLMNFNYDSLGNWDPKIINKAVLVLPVQDFASDPFDPSVSLFLAKIVDENLSTYTLDYPPNSSGLGAVNYDQDNKEYRFLVTRELQGMLSGEREFTGFRIYCPAFFGSSIERVVFNGASTSLKERPRLEITYTNY